MIILTTFNLDEYVYEALRVGASGFVLKDDPPEQLIGAVRTVAAGEALLSPTVTQRLIEQFTTRSRPKPPREYDGLTAREREIFLLIAQGLSNAEIAERLVIGDTTVKTPVTRILQKLRLRDRVKPSCWPTGPGCCDESWATGRSTVGRPLSYRAGALRLADGRVGGSGQGTRRVS